MAYVVFTDIDPRISWVTGPQRRHVVQRKICPKEELTALIQEKTDATLVWVQSVSVNNF